ncbi:MAG: hypothetical protein ACTSUM_01205 [Alphaproteobacteria bacterium]
MIQISQKQIDKFQLDFKAGIYKRTTKEAIEFEKKLEVEKLANKTWQEKRVEAYGNIGSQLGEIYDDIEAWRTRIAKIKIEIPKAK